MYESWHQVLALLKSCLTLKTFIKMHWLGLLDFFLT